MGKTLIKVECVDQRLLVSSGPIIASGGRNEDEIEFGFCPLWDEFEKTAVFYREKDRAYHAIIVDNRCVIPHEVLIDEGWLYFGVIGVKGDITRTSEIMKYRVAEGAITEGTKPSDPTPDIYEQILRHITNIEKTIAHVTPEMFGAIGDGVTDDSDAIQAMLDHGGLCVCSGTYLIGKDVRLYAQDATSDNHAYPRSIVKGDNGTINQLSSQSHTGYLSARSATFVFAGGRFLVKYTSQVDFEDCVFMGSLNNEDMTQTAFICESPFRKLHISNSTFANLEYAIRGEVATGDWCGENTFENLYFALCKNCIHIEKGGLDSRVCKCIVQRTCENFLYLTNATGCMIVENHDYSEYGCVLYGAFIFSSNYIDGLGKLAVQGQTSDNSTTMGPTITGNLFMASATETETQYAIRVVNMLFGATIAGNTFMNGQNGKIILLDMREANYFQANKVFANSGRIMGYVNDSTASKYATSNMFDCVGMEWLTPCGAASHKSLITCGEGVVGFVRIPSPSQSTTGIVLQLNSLPCRVVNEITIGHTDGSVEYDFTTGNVINTTKYSDMAYITVKSLVRFGANDKFSIPFHVAP